ncbi:MAG: MFS transporter [Phenylobacterium sp.]|uniref:MFS transporter n=1 Tax=Phenylobacterium sp. TaxID=1871053 RepID=UPI001A5DE2B4|nr:MFS transporter [Phenylobacterium sp.]MBL8554366.1 MFS transporter [Phenylobacterium sp.]
MIAKTTAGARERPHFGWLSIGLYGAGSISNSVKSSGLATFLMIFYNQVMGLPASLVGLGIGFALVVDAFIDPAVGQLSDNTRTRWGRRHPFMYAAAAPVAICFFLIWNPPSGLEGLRLFAYMMACLLTIRLFDTFFELPSSALMPELVEGYDRRTVVVAVRVLMSTLGSMGMTVFAYQVAMKEQPGGGGGVLAKDGYFSYSIVGALVIATTILISSIATHRFIPWLRQAGPAARTNHLKQIFEVLKNRAFLTIMGSGALVYLVAGITQGLAIYISLFFWQLTQGQLAILAATTAAASLTGVILAPQLTRRIGKKEAALIGYFVGAMGELTPFILRLLGVAPENGDPALFYLLAAGRFVNFVSWSVTGICISAMIADVVEDNAVRTGRRSEGFLFAADSLFKKIASAGGPALAGLVLSAAHFPIGARKGEVAPEVLQTLITLYLPMLVAIYTVSMSIMAFYNIDRHAHAANLEALKRA